MKKDKKRTEGFVKIIGYLFLAMIIFIITFSLPDLILLIRKTFLKISFLNVFLDQSIDEIQYIEMMLTVITCLITATLSVIAYHLSKEIGKLNIAGKKAKDAYAAYCLGEYIKKNSRIIYKVKKDIGDLRELIYLEEMFKHWAVVKSLDVFSNGQKNFFYNYNQLIRCIKTKYDQNHSDLDNKINLFCDMYLNMLEDEFVFNDDMNKIVEILNMISDGGAI